MPKVKCYKCGREYNENPDNKKVYPKECPFGCRGEKVFKNVKVIDFDMEFGSMVLFMIKWAIASIPAMIILFLLGVLIAALVGGLSFFAFN